MADVKTETNAFWGSVEIRSTRECWLWTGARTDNGYGRFRRVRAHRLAYQLGNGDIPSGLLVRHLCGNKLCVNPRHLALGTNADNARDGIRLGEILRGSASARAKLTESDVDHIKANPDNLTGRQLAARFNVHEATVSLIRSGRRWSHVEQPEEQAA